MFFFSFFPGGLLPYFLFLFSLTKRLLTITHFCGVPSPSIDRLPYVILPSFSFFFVFSMVWFRSVSDVHTHLSRVTQCHHLSSKFAALALAHSSENREKILL